MKRYEYKFKGNVVAIVDVGMHGVAFFRTPFDGRFTKTTESDAHALAKGYLEQLKHVTPSPMEG